MFLAGSFRAVYRYRRLLFKTAFNDVRTRYAGSILGLFWLFFYPLLLLGTYAMVYLFIYKVRFKLFNSDEYVALIFCGLIPFIGFSDSIGNGVGSVVTNSSLVKNTLFPIELVPLKAVLASQSTQGAGMLLLLAALAFLHRWSMYVPLFLVIWCLQILFTGGLMWFLSSLNVYFRDLQSIMGVIILILMMISPIAYSQSMIPSDLRPFLAINPLYYFIVSYQDVLMLGQLPSTHIILVLVIMSFLFYMVGYWFFMKMKRVFVDNV